MLNQQRRLKVFLCHAHEDEAVVRRLYQRLIRDGVDAWLDKEKLLAGQDWRLEIARAVGESDVVIVCLSKQFNQPGFRQKEVKLALDTADLQPEGKIFIIPARLEECENLKRLENWHWVNLFEKDGYEKLMRALHARAEDVFSTGDRVISIPPLERGPALEAGNEIPSPAPWSRTEWQAGDRVLARWSHDEYWYPATIRALAGDRVYILFDDGDKEWTTRDCMMAMDIEVGDAVLCKYKGGRYYYSAHVLEMEGEQIYVQYEYDQAESAEDPAMGEKQWTTISAVRVTR